MRERALKKGNADIFTIAGDDFCSPFSSIGDRARRRCALHEARRCARAARDVICERRKRNIFIYDAPPRRHAHFDAPPRHYARAGLRYAAFRDRRERNACYMPPARSAVSRVIACQQADFLAAFIARPPPLGVAACFTRYDAADRSFHCLPSGFISAGVH